MKKKTASTKIYGWLTGLFALGFLYTYGQVMQLFRVNPLLGAVGSVGFPVLVWLVYRGLLYWISKDYPLDERYTKKSRHVRVWAMVLEWIIGVTSVLIITPAFTTPWTQSIVYVVLGIVLFLGYPYYARRVLTASIEDGVLRDTVEKRLIMTSSVFGAAGLVLGCAEFILTIVGRLVS